MYVSAETTPLSGTRLNFIKLNLKHLFKSVFSGRVGDRQVVHREPAEQVRGCADVGRPLAADPVAAADGGDDAERRAGHGPPGEDRRQDAGVGVPQQAAGARRPAGGT